jgi:hypothetical protein
VRDAATNRRTQASLFIIDGNCLKEAGPLNQQNYGQFGDELFILFDERSMMLQRNSNG